MNMTSAQFAALSQLFSSTVFTELARGGCSPKFARLARELQNQDAFGCSRSVGCFFKAAFKLLSREGVRHEYVYKSALTSKILLGRHSLRTASMLSEFRVGECKADIVVLNGTSTVYEIKSERDSLARLDRQLAAYSTVFASVQVVCSATHREEVLRAVPAHVGVCELTSRHHLSTVREPLIDANRVSPVSIFECLRINEAKAVLLLYGYSVPSVPNTLMSSELRARFLQLTPEQAHNGMVHVLKSSRNLLPLKGLLAELPDCLHSAALSIPLRKMDRVRLVEAVQTPLHEGLAWD